MLKSGAELKLIQMSFPPLPPPAVVGSPSRPTPNVQWPAVRTTVGEMSVLEQR